MGLCPYWHRGTHRSPEHGAVSTLALRGTHRSPKHKAVPTLALWHSQEPRAQGCARAGIAGGPTLRWARHSRRSHAGESLSPRPGLQNMPSNPL